MLRLSTSWIAPPPGTLALPTATSHVWHAPLSVSQGYDFLSCLAADEVARAKKMSSYHNRRRFLAGRAALRYTLARYSGKSPKCFSFIYGKSGKPRLTGELAEQLASLNFNVSHTTTNVFIAFARDTPVGIDVEALARKVTNFEAVVRRFTTPFERICIERKMEESNEAARRYLLYLWTRKEAYAKATGSGISSRLFSSLNVIPGHETYPDTEENRSPPPSIRSFTIEDEIVGAIVSLAPTIDTTFYKLSTG